MKILRFGGPSFSRQSTRNAQQIQKNVQQKKYYKKLIFFIILKAQGTAGEYLQQI